MSPTADAPLRWDPETLWERLQPLAPGLSVEVLSETGSTNTDLLERVRAGDTGPALLVAERQTAGRGRLGRTWWSRPGASLTFSLALPLRTADWSGLSLTVGVALAEALHPRIGLKWPNDLWLRPDEVERAAGRLAARKLGGILIETTPAPDGQRVAVIGMGLNIAPREDAQEGPGAAAEGVFGSGYACLQDLLPGVQAPDVLAQVAPVLLQRLTEFERGGFAPLRERFEARDLLRGLAVRAGDRTGVADGVDTDGGLRLRTDTGTVSITSGEVSVRPC
jgi:BirA family biotin operon repressor/biotin-[acetyl-CoA-carboxylase] ligase